MTTPAGTGLETPHNILQMLYPGLPTDAEHTRGFGRVTSGQRRLIGVPNLEDTRMILSLESSLASAALRRARRSIDLRGQVVTAVAASGLRLGLGRVLRVHLEVPVTADCVETQLATLLGRSVRTAIFLGPPRANRKPVLQVLAMDGELLAVAKVGVNRLTSDLAAAEAAALRAVSERGFATVVTPRLLSEESRQGHHMVVQSPLAIPKGQTEPRPALLRAVFNEIARSGGVARASLGEGTYLQGLRERLSATPSNDLSALGSVVLSAVAADGAVIDFGAWHGDLSPWNMAADGHKVLVWDWERFVEGVPVGFDALHYAFLPRLKDISAPQSEAGVHLLAQAPDLLHDVGVTPEHAPVVAMLYLLDVGTRFVQDGQVRTGVLGGDVEQWLVPAMRHYLARERK